MASLSLSLDNRERSIDECLLDVIELNGTDKWLPSFLLALIKRHKVNI